MEVEIWKEIENHPNYLISNFGRIKSNKITINKENKYYQTRLVRDCYGYYFLKPHKESNGYLVVFIDGKFYKMHRLVATAFIKNNNNKQYVNHIDGNKTNNHYDNLEWVTAKENVIHAIKHNLVKHPSGKDNYNSKSIKATNGKQTISFFTEMAGAKFFGVSVKAINNCLKGRSKTCAGMLWSYDD